MTRVYLFKYPGWLAKFFLVFGVIIFILGFIQLIMALLSGFSINFPSGDWASVFYVIQGILLVIMGNTAHINRKYYIEWDNRDLRFFLPGTKKVELIRYEDIISVQVRLFEIILSTKAGVRIFDLNNLSAGDLRKVKEKFSTLAEINQVKRIATLNG